MSLVFNTPKSALNTTSKAIQNLKSGECPEPSLTTESVEYTENGEYSVATPEGFDGLSAVSVTVNIDTEAIADAAYADGEAAQKAKLTSLNVTSNGTYNREDGYNSVTVNVPSSEPNLETGVVEEAHLYGDYHPSEGYDGFATISVSVSPSAKGTAANPFISAEDITEEVDTAGAISMGSYYSVTLTEDDTIEFLDIDQADDKTYVITKASTDADYPDAIFHIVERSEDHYKEWPTGFSLKAGDTLLLCGTDVIEGGFSMLYAYNGNLDETTWASSGSSCPDWSTIGWDCNDVAAAGIDADLAYTAEAKDYYERTGGFNTYKSLVFAPVFENGVSSFNGLFSLQSKLKYVPNVYLNSNPRDYSATRMFYSCSSLTRIPNIDTSEITDMSNMFYGCSSLTEAPNIDTSSATSFNHMFTSCNISTIPQYNTQSLQNAANFLNVNINKLVSIPQLNFVSVNNIANVIGQNNQNNLTTLGGFTNLGKAFISTDTALYHLLDLSKAPNLTKQSIMNVINNLAAPDDTAVTDATLKLSATSYALLSAEDIAIATAKRWSVTSA